MIGRLWDCITILLPTSYPPLDWQQGKDTSTRLQSPSSPAGHTSKSPSYRLTIPGTRNRNITRSLGYHGRDQGIVQISIGKARGRAGI